MLYICLLLALFDFIQCQPAGWRLVDRFYGFRYELKLNGNIDGFEQQIVNEGDKYGCFGWIQYKIENTWVGEARCNKKNGPKFEQYLIHIPNTINVVTKVYEDTKIRLHPSHFKIYDSSKDTCFVDPPHQCNELFVEPPIEENRQYTATGSGSESGSGTTETYKRNEL